MRNLFFRIASVRQNYWFWPSAMSALAVFLGFFLPWVDSVVGTGWMGTVSFLRPTQVDGARAILTTLAGATLGVAGVAFSVTIVAVSFASSNYGPRLIGNFMADRTNQIVLGIFVATFVYCITVLSTVHAQLERTASTEAAFVPQGSVFFALVLTLSAVGALIVYIHHIPESINIMNVSAKLGSKLQQAVSDLLDAYDAQDEGKDASAVSVEPWASAPPTRDVLTQTAQTAGFLQRLDFDRLAALAREREVQIVVYRSPGDFIVPGEVVLWATPAQTDDEALSMAMRDCVSLGSNRTDVQDILFLSDQLVEVLGRALSPGINDPSTAMLCLDWLRAGLTTFATRSAPPPARHGDPVIYRRVCFEDMLDRSFDQMRQYVAADRTVTLHAMGILSELARIASTPAMTEACRRQMRRLAASALDMLPDAETRAEIEALRDRIASTSAPARA